MTGSYTICWHIFRMGNKDTIVKAAGKDCPCKHDPEKNKKCPLYEEVIIHQ
jgi:hypothetical protein